jgi:ankyrin repeat protein
MTDGETDGLVENSRGKTLLVIACGKGDMNVVKRLIEQGADVNKPDRKGKRPLHKACSNGHTAIADVDAGSEGGNTPLMYACRSDHTETVRLLLQHGADVRQKSKFGGTALLDACGRIRNIPSNIIAILKLLLVNGAIVNEPSPFGTTPLHFATMWEHREAVQLLLEHGADVNAIPHSGVPILALYTNPDAEITRTLLSHGANVYASDRREMLPIHRACREGHADIARELLLGEANINAATPSGELPFAIACENGARGVIQLLLDYGSGLGEAPNYA